MKTTTVLVFCFLWVFAFAENTQNTTRLNNPNFDLSKSSDANAFFEKGALFPDVLITYTISGKVYHSGSPLVPFPGVIMTCSDGVIDTTNALGEYSFVVERNWSGTVTPYYCDQYSFSPVNRTYTLVKLNYLGQDFTATPTDQYIINGTFINVSTGLGIANFTVDFGNGITTTTNSQGQYSLEVSPCVSYTLTPTSNEFNFTPLSRSYPNLIQSFYNQDYEAQPVGLVPLPPGWDHPANAEQVHIISIRTSANPAYCGVPIQAGDWIGVFYTGDDALLHCGGAGLWTGTENTQITALGNDNYTPAKDGFTYGELITWKVYSTNTTQLEYPAFPVFETGGILTSNNKWYPGGLSIVSSLPINKTHSLQLPQGWSGISSYILPRTGTATITVLMAPILSKLVILQNLTKTYWPSQSVNTIINWSSVSGYKIKVTEPVTLPITGCDYSPKTVSLVTGWNLIPVLSDCNVPIESLFAANLNKITVIKEIAGSNIYWPAVNIKTLLNLQTGKAYLMRVTSNFSVTFPACTSLKDEEIFNAVVENNSPWNDPLMTPSNHSIALPSGVLGKLMTGDVIGAFTEDGICAGMVQINDVSESYLLQVFGDDQTTLEKDGFDESEFLNFKLFRPQINQEFEIGFDFDATMPSSDGVFTTDGLSVAGKIVFNPTYIGENSNTSISFFPNPGNGLIEFVAGDGNRKFNVTILDLTGQKVDETSFSGKTRMNFSNAPKGIYFVKIESDNFVKVQKLIIQ